MTKNKVKNTKTKMRRSVKKLGKQKIKVTDIRVNNQALVTDENQARVNFLKSLYSLRMNLSGVAKNLNGYGYKYQNFNEIIREIKNVIKSNNLDIDFLQCPTFKVVGNNTINVITTTFYSPSSGYSESFDTPIYTEEFSSLGAKNQNTLSQLVGSCITYHKRYALVGYLSIESEVDTDASSLEHIQGANEELASSVNVPLVNSLKRDKTVNTKRVTKGETKQPPVSHKSVTSLDKLPKRIPVKYHYYQNLLQASKRMHSVLDHTPFDSLETIDKFLLQLNNADDSSILEFFETKPELKTIDYWRDLINSYLKRTKSDPEVIEGFSKFLACRESKYGQSPLKLFGYIASDDNFGYLCNN
ncbi:ERF family protein [Borrelia puertoricensis]|uniref:ERF family protein n=1 Tax=Borrelia puertoricensis TaxID=2756107 RepID=UPI001FF289D6|nr:ERF family protein [Borrelia puertoricensis]